MSQIRILGPPRKPTLGRLANYIVLGANKILTLDPVPDDEGGLSRELRSTQRPLVCGEKQPQRLYMG